VKDVKGIGRGYFKALSQRLPVPMETTMTIRYDCIMCPDRESSPEICEYEAGVLATKHHFFICNIAVKYMFRRFDV
jgi:hypothetical protein